MILRSVIDLFIDGWLVILSFTFLRFQKGVFYSFISCITMLIYRLLFLPSFPLIES